MRTRCETPRAVVRSSLRSYINLLLMCRVSREAATRADIRVRMYVGIFLQCFFFFSSITNIEIVRIFLFKTTLSHVSLLTISPSPPLSPSCGEPQSDHSFSSSSESSSDSLYSTAMRRDRMVATSLPTRSCLASCSRCSSTFRSWIPGGEGRGRQERGQRGQGSGQLMVEFRSNSAWQLDSSGIPDACHLRSADLLSVVFFPWIQSTEPGKASSQRPLNAPNRRPRTRTGSGCNWSLIKNCPFSSAG